MPGARKLTEGRRRLAGRHVALARLLARPFKDQFPDWSDEFESAACLALVESAARYRPERGAKFTTFAGRRIRGALLDARRARHRLVSPEMPWEEAQPLAEMLGDGRPAVGAALEADEDLGRLLRPLPAAHAAALRRIYRDGATHAQIGAELGLSPSRITALHRESLAMLAGTLRDRRCSDAESSSA